MSNSTPNKGNARDREMGRTDEPLGDLGQGHETWKPPAGQQGMSNRPDDEGTPADGQDVSKRPDLKDQGVKSGRRDEEAGRGGRRRGA